MPERLSDSRLTHDDVLRGVAEVVHLVTGRPVAEVLPERTFVDDLAMVEILEGTAQRLGVRLEDEAAKGFVRVGDLVEHVVLLG